MSYMPDDQQLSQSLDGLVTAMDDLDRRMRARMDDPSRWSESHLEELAGLSSQLARIRAQLRALQHGTY